MGYILILLILAVVGAEYQIANEKSTLNRIRKGNKRTNLTK